MWNMEFHSGILDVLLGEKFYCSNISMKMLSN